MPENRTTTETHQVQRELKPGGFFSPFIEQQYVEAWSRDAFAMFSEVATFAQARWHADMDNWGKLATCRNPMEAIECQQEAAQKAYTDYLEEFGKLSRLASNLISDGFLACQSQRVLEAVKKSVDLV